MMNIETKFIVNKEKRTVVCIMTTYNEIARRLDKYDLIDVLDYLYGNEVRTYVGVAKCAPDDEWDESYGRHMAEYKAMKLRKADVNRELKAIIKRITKNIDNLYDYGMIKEPHRP